MATGMATGKDAGKGVVHTKPDYLEKELAGIDSFDSALHLVHQAMGDVVVADQALGDGFVLLKEEEKRRLVGIPVLLMEWIFSPGDFGEDFVSVKVVGKVPGGGIVKAIMNDGSTGICQQLRALTAETGMHGGLMARNGLRVSEYLYDTEKGAVVPRAARTSRRALRTT